MARFEPGQPVRCSALTALLILVAAVAVLASAVALASAAPAPPSLELSSDEPAPGTQLQATARDFYGCPTTPAPAGDIPATITFRWSGGADHATAVDGTATVTLQVPSDAVAGTYTVTASCEGGPSATLSFTVSTPAPEAALALKPEHGPPGSSFTATATGFGPCRLMSIRWGDHPPVNGSARDEQTFTLQVPDDAKAGVETVSASCVGGATASAPFTVEAVAAPTLTLKPSEGPVGTQFTVSGTGFVCESGQVDLRWDGDSSIGSASTDSFTVQLRVPSTASVGEHRLLASCSEDPVVEAGQVFAVSESPTTPSSPTVSPSSTTPVVSPSSAATPAVIPTVVTTPPETSTETKPPPGASILPWIFGIVVLGGLGYMVRRVSRRKPLTTPEQFHVTPRPGGSPRTTVRETPVNGEATHAIRLEVHPDPGIQTLMEVTR